MSIERRLQTEIKDSKIRCSREKWWFNIQTIFNEENWFNKSCFRKYDHYRWRDL